MSVAFAGPLPEFPQGPFHDESRHEVPHPRVCEVIGVHFDPCNVNPLPPEDV